MNKEKVQLLGGVLLVISLCLFATPGIPSRFYQPDVKTYFDARQSPFAQEARFRHRKLLWLCAGFSFLASLACFGIANNEGNRFRDRKHNP